MTKRQKNPLTDLGRLAWVANSTFEVITRSNLRKAGYGDLRESSIHVLGVLANSDSEKPLQALTLELGLSKAAAGQLIAGLAKRKYLRRMVDPGDKRRILVSLTPRGRAAGGIVLATRDMITDKVGQYAPTDAIQKALECLIAMRVMASSSNSD